MCEYKLCDSIIAVGLQISFDDASGLPRAHVLIASSPKMAKITT